MAAAGAARAAPPSAHPTQVAALSVGMPSEFLSLAAEHQLVADVFFGGRRIGQFGIVATPGTIHILHPEAIVAAMAGLSDPRAVRDALGGTLDSNARYICTESQDVCGRPSPDVAAVVFDEKRFRLDLYVNPRLLAVQPVTTDRYLKPTQTGLALVDTIGGAIAGGDGERPITTSAIAPSSPTAMRGSSRRRAMRRARASTSIRSQPSSIGPTSATPRACSTRRAPIWSGGGASSGRASPRSSTRGPIASS